MSAVVAPVAASQVPPGMAPAATVPPPPAPPPFWRRPAFWLWSGVGLIALFLLYLFPEKSPSRTAIATTAKTAAPAPWILATAGTGQLAKGERTEATVQVQNRGNTDLSGLWLTVSAPGLALTQPAMPSCRLPGDSATEVPTSVLKSGQSCTFHVPLQALAASGSYTLLLRLEWLQPDRQHALLSLGPLRMEGLWGRDALVRFARRFGQILKDLTLPILLLILTSWFDRKQREREKKQAALEEAQKQQKELDEQTKEEARVATEKIRDEENRVRQLLLTKVLSMAEKHYLQISAEGKAILQNFETWKAAPAPAPTDRLFYHTMYLVWRMRVLREDCGGMFFLDSQGERIAGSSWSLLKPAISAVIGESEVQTALNELAKDHTETYFCEKQKLTVAGAERFARWVHGDPSLTARWGTFAEFLPLIDVMQAVYLFETNVPLQQYWYKETAGLRLFLSDHSIPTRLESLDPKSYRVFLDVWPSYRDKNLQARSIPAAHP